MPIRQKKHGRIGVKWLLYHYNIPQIPYIWYVNAEYQGFREWEKHSNFALINQSRPPACSRRSLSFECDDALRVALKNQRKGKSQRQKVVSFYKLFRSYEQDQTNATIWILLLPKYDDDNDVRDCWNNSIQA